MVRRGYAARYQHAAPAGRPRLDWAPRSIPELRADSARRLAAAAARDARELVLRRLGRRADTLLYRVESRSALTGGGTTIPSYGAVLSATGHAREMVDELARRRGVVKVVARLGTWNTPPRAVVGGWPRVVTGGVNVGAGADSLEGTMPRFSSARHPRSAIAISGDSSQLMLVVVDGRRPWSVGMSLSELADALIAFGARDAMNLDGGGSSTLDPRDGGELSLGCRGRARGRQRVVRASAERAVKGHPLLAGGVRD